MSHESTRISALMARVRAAKDHHEMTNDEFLGSLRHGYITKNHGLTKSSVSKWLSGIDMPGGEYALALVDWEADHREQKQHKAKT